MLLDIIIMATDNKKNTKRKPNWTENKNVVVLEERGKHKYIIHRTISTSRTCGNKQLTKSIPVNRCIDEVKEK